MNAEMSLKELMAWHLDAGVDETIGDEPVDRFQAPASVASMPEAAEPPPSPRSPAASPPAGAGPRLPSPPPETRGAPVDKEMLSHDKAVRSAVELAQSAKSLDDLRAALADFDGCALKKTATNLVLADGPETAKLMFVGEAPGAEEDRQGLPFVGPSGRLLDAMLAFVGIARAEVLISNTVFWRPPGNRTPTMIETSVCQPFIERLIEIVDPKVLVCVGGPAAKVLLGETQGVGRLRGRWFDYSSRGLTHPVPATVIFHPAYLLRTPIKKRDAWADIRSIHRKLTAH